MSMNKRINANLELLEKLGFLMVEYPELRFGQILTSFGFINPVYSDDDKRFWEDEYYAESLDILNRVKGKLNE